MLDMNKLGQNVRNKLHFLWFWIVIVCIIITYYYQKSKATESYKTIVQTAASNCSLEIVKLLMKNIMPELSETALHFAARGGCLDTIRFLILEEKVSIDALDQYAFKRTALHHATAHGHIEVVKFLLENGANPNIEDDDHRKPIKMAVMESRYDKNKSKHYAKIIRLLAEAEQVNQ